MSASREKKQRQGAGPSDKSIQAQQDQAVRKRKTIIYSVIGVVAAVLVAALLIWNSGFFQARATAATIGGTTLTAGELSYYYYGLRNEYASYASVFGYSFDSSIPESEQYRDEAQGITWRDFFLDSALTTAQQYISLADEALNSGYTADDVKTQLNSTIDSMKSSAASNGYSYAAYLRAMYGPYMTPAIYEEQTTRYLLASRIFNDKGTELTKSYVDADLEKFYSEHADALDTIEYSYLYFTPEAVETKDADGNDLAEDVVNQRKEEALAAAKATAEEALAAYEDGEEISHLIERFAPYSSNDHAAAVGTTSISSIYQEKLLSLKEDEAAIVENSTSGYYLVVFHSRYLAEDPTKDVRHILVRAENVTEEHDDHSHDEVPTDEAWAAAKEKADSILAEYEAGSKTEDAFATLANQYSDDGGSNTTGGLYERIAITDSYVPEFMDWIFADGRQAGDTGIVQHAAGENDGNKYWGYHIMYLVGDNEPVWKGTARANLADAARDEWMLALSGNYEAALADGSNSIGS